MDGVFSFGVCPDPFGSVAGNLGGVDESNVTSFKGYFAFTFGFLLLLINC